PRGSTGAERRLPIAASANEARTPGSSFAISSDTIVSGTTTAVGQNGALSSEYRSRKAQQAELAAGPTETLFTRRWTPRPPAGAPSRGGPRSGPLHLASLWAHNSVGGIPVGARSDGPRSSPHGHQGRTRARGDGQSSARAIRSR